MTSGLNQFEAMYNDPKGGRFFFPQRIVWGDDNINQLVSLVKSPVEIFIDRELKDEPFVVALLDCIEARPNEPEPVINFVEGPWFEDVEAFTKRFPKCPSSVISVGGGSTFDFAKAVTAIRIFGFLSGLGIGELAGLQAPSREPPLMICVPTTCGSGAESSRYVVTYSRTSHRKIHGKSWALCADWVFVEPSLLASAPWDVQVSTAFDAFVHFFETLGMKNETSTLSKMLSVHGMASIVEHLDRLAFVDRRSNDSLRELLICGTLGGVAISNTRTGHIHEAAGIILEQTGMSHGFSLWACFPALSKDVVFSVSSRFDPLFQLLGERSLSMPIESYGDLLSWWQSVFQTTEFVASGKLDRAVGALDAAGLLEAIIAHIMRDKTWVDKESPFTVNEDVLRSVIPRIVNRDETRRT